MQVQIESVRYKVQCPNCQKWTYDIEDYGAEDMIEHICFKCKTVIKFVSPLIYFTRKYGE